MYDVRRNGASVRAMQELFEQHFTGVGVKAPRERHVVVASRKNADIEYIAPAPLDRRASFTGSGLPYPSARHAFSDSPNQGRARSGGDGRVELAIVSPNGFYECSGTEYHDPFVILRFADGQTETHALPQAATVCRVQRDLTYHEARTSPMFYERAPVVEDQWVRLIRTADFSK